MHSQSLQVVIKLTDSLSGKPVPNVQAIRFGSLSVGRSDESGKLILKINSATSYSITFRHIAYEVHNRSFTFNKETMDTMRCELRLIPKSNVLEPVTVTAIHRPETLVGKPFYSVFDFEFCDLGYLLLTSGRSLAKAELRLSDLQGEILHTIPVPSDAGKAERFYRDYEKNIFLVCELDAFRIEVIGREVFLFSVGHDIFSRSIEPVIDVTNQHCLFSDQWQAFPSFNYKIYQFRDSIIKVIANVEDVELMKLYRLEYYYLPPGLQLAARKTARQLGADKFVVAAHMTGFVNGRTYDPLYAPVFMLEDTLLLFDHYSDRLFKFTKDGKKQDSVPISYHHPERWQDWKRQLIQDDATDKVFALYSKNGHKYLKEVNLNTGDVNFTYSLKNHSAEKLKIRNGFVYYIYRPFESTQEKFLYRERIESGSAN